MNYETLASQESIDRVIAAAGARGVQALVVGSGAEALEKIKELVPKGASVMNGSSVTLEKIGYIDYLTSGKHDWINPKDAILAEQDKAKQSLLRRQSVVSDFYLGSAHAVAETGEMVFGSNSGSQLPHIAFTSRNLIFVVSTKKIVPTLADALKRLEEYVVPLEDQHMKSKGAPGTLLSKTLIFQHENPMMGRKVWLMLVKEDLGF